MKAIYFKLKESSLSSAASNGEREKDKDGALCCRPPCVVNAPREEEGLSEAEVRKGEWVGEKTKSKRQIKQAW